MHPRNRFSNWTALALPLVILASVLVIFLPLPSVWLDVFLAANLATSALILLTAVFVRTPLEFSFFPAILLVTTLSRIALNVATTRLILSRGPLDHELAAGYVVRGFGEFVAGDQLAVGLVIFLILFIVQFLVITSGTTRIGEVAARFALDGLPGRQMAIDADLNAGVIDHAEAHRQRNRLLDNADFYGSMDGASKYVRGDAIAGLCITAINLIGGLLFGLSQGMDLNLAIGTFSKLTIGDGLASQLPALLISLAAGLLVSRGSATASLSEQSVGQVFGKPMALVLTAVLMVVLAFTNMPLLPLLAISSALLGMAWYSWNQYPPDRIPDENLKAGDRDQKTGDGGGNRSLEKLLEALPLQIELGSRLVHLADAAQGGTLRSAVVDLRQQLAKGLGLILPSVHLRDNLRLSGNEFRIVVDDFTVMTSAIPSHSVLRIGRAPAGQNSNAPAGLPWAASGIWIDERLVDLAADGMTLTPVDVISHSLQWAALKYVETLVDRDSLKQLMEETRRQHPVIVSDFESSKIDGGTLLAVVRDLLSESVPVRPFHRLLEAVIECAADGPGKTMSESVRKRMSRGICRQLCDANGTISCFGLSEDLEARVIEATGTGNGSGLKSKPGFTAGFVQSVETGIRHMQNMGVTPVMMVRAELRASLAELFKSLRPVLHVVGEDEIDNAVNVDMIARIRLGDLHGSATSAA